MAGRWGDGEAYDRLMGRWSRQLAPRFVAWARLPTGGSAIDVGCGTGSLSAALLGAGLRPIVGVDPSPAYVARAAANLGAAHGVSFQVGDATHLPANDEEFDVAASNLVLNFVANPSAAVSEMHRVVRRGGVVAACVWDYAEGMALTRQFWDAAIACDLPEARERDEGRHFRVCRPGPLRDLFLRAGLGGVEVGAIDLPIVFRDFDDYWRPILGGQGPLGGYAMGLREADRAALREALHDRLPRGPAGTIPLTCRAWAVRGVRP